MKLLKLAAATAIASSFAMSAQAGFEFPTDSCFWAGPYVKENPVTNIAFPDAGAKYWTGKYTLPEGAKLELWGRFPHARYMSFNSYNANIGPNGEQPTYAPVDVVRDEDMDTLHRFATNPFVDGANRKAFLRGYKLELASGMPQESDSPNVLRSSVADGEQAVIVLRHYVEDEGLGATAGEFLPSPVLRMADGKVLTKPKQVCAELMAISEIVEPPTLPADYFAGIMRPGGNQYWASQGFAPFGLAAATEKNPASLRRSFNPKSGVACDYFFSCDYEGPQDNGFYANIDNAYTYAYISNAPKSYTPVAPSQLRPLGLEFTMEEATPDLAVTVFRGKLPTTPKTLSGDKRMSEGQMRYWSFCTNEYYSQKVTDCVYDEQLVTDEEGNYTIAISWSEDRPSNAIEECGINWLPMSGSGDGFGDMMGNPALNNSNESLVVIRNMAPAADFDQAIQNIPSQTTTATTLGEYNTTYYQTSVADFEAKGCY